MPTVVLASALARWLPDAKKGEVSLEAGGNTVREVLESLFAIHPVLRGYVVDEHGTVRHHVALFVDGEALPDKRRLDQAVGPRATIHVMQALSGG